MLVEKTRISQPCFMTPVGKNRKLDSHDIPLHSHYMSLYYHFCWLNPNCCWPPIIIIQIYHHELSIYISDDFFIFMGICLCPIFLLIHIVNTCGYSPRLTSPFYCLRDRNYPIPSNGLPSFSENEMTKTLGPYPSRHGEIQFNSGSSWLNSLYSDIPWHIPFIIFIPLDVPLNPIICPIKSHYIHYIRLNTFLYTIIYTIIFIISIIHPITSH